jgi:hypothetical protein
MPKLSYDMPPPPRPVAFPFELSLLTTEQVVALMTIADSGYNPEVIKTFPRETLVALVNSMEGRTRASCVAEAERQLAELHK